MLHTYYRKTRDKEYYRSHKQINWANYPHKLFHARKAFTSKNEKLWFFIIYGLVGIALFAITLSIGIMLLYCLLIACVYHYHYVKQKAQNDPAHLDKIPTFAVNETGFVLLLKELSSAELHQQNYLVIPFSACECIRFDRRSTRAPMPGPFPEDRGRHSMAYITLKGTSGYTLSQALDKETDVLLYEAAQQYAPHILKLNPDPLPFGSYIAASIGLAIGIGICIYLTASHNEWSQDEDMRPELNSIYSR